MRVGSHPGIQKSWPPRRGRLPGPAQETELKVLSERGSPPRGAFVKSLSLAYKTVAWTVPIPMSLRGPEFLTHPGGALTHTPSIAFRHLPPTSARFSYATEGALFISAQLSTDAVIGLRKVWVLMTVPKHARKHETHPSRVKKEKNKEEFRLESNDFGLISAGVSNIVSYKTNV